VRRWTIFACPDCGAQVRNRLGESPVHRHPDRRVFIAEPIEVVSLSEVKEALLGDDTVEAAKAALASVLPTVGPDRAAFAADVNSAAFAALEAARDSAFPSDSDQEPLCHECGKQFGETEDCSVCSEHRVIASTELRAAAEDTGLPSTDSEGQG
jgi:hypothetical protein